MVQRCILGQGSPVKNLKASAPFGKPANVIMPKTVGSRAESLYTVLIYRNAYLDYLAAYWLTVASDLTLGRLHDLLLVLLTGPCDFIFL